MELVFSWNDVTNECSGSLDYFILLLVDLPAIQRGVWSCLCPPVSGIKDMIRVSGSIKPASLRPPPSTHRHLSPALHRACCHHHNLHLPDGLPPPKSSLNRDQLFPSQLPSGRRYLWQDLPASWYFDQWLHLSLLQVHWHSSIFCPLCDGVQKIKTNWGSKSASKSRVPKWWSLSLNIYCFL